MTMEDTKKSTNEKIIEQVRAIETLLIEKNIAYGDSATNPANVFSKKSPRDSICARIDDKLNRIKNRGLNDHTEDTVTDLIGYLILLKIVLQDERDQPTRQEDNGVQDTDGHSEPDCRHTWTSSSTSGEPKKVFFNDY
jgi:hypothetical protein